MKYDESIDDLLERVSNADNFASIRDGMVAARELRLRIDAGEIPSDLSTAGEMVRRALASLERREGRMC